MPANISANTYDPAKQYDKVILQQGKPVTDYDFNESQDIQRGRIRNAIYDMFGDGAIGDGWKIIGTGATNDFTITAGNCYVGGYRANLGSNGTAVATFGLTLTTPTADRVDMVYLDIYEIEIDSTVDPGIVHNKLRSAGIEPTRRIKIKADLKIVEGDSIPAAGTGHYYFWLAEIHRLANNATITAPMIIDRRKVNDNVTLFDSMLGHDHNGINSKKVTAANITVVDSANKFAASDAEAALLELFNKIANHETATTGIHGVGASTIESAAGAQTKVDAKMSTHLAAANPHPQYSMGSDLTNHKQLATLDHPDNSVTDAKIGNRTVNQAITTTMSNTATLTDMLSFFSKQFRAISGKTNWYDTPTKSIEILINDLTAHTSATTGVHGVGSSTVESAAGAQAKIDASLTSHTGATNPHTQYTLTTDFADHVSAVNPHTGHALTSTIITAGTGLTGGGSLAANRTISIATGGVTDTLLGNRTITDTTAPTADAAAVTTLFSNIGYMLKSITGAASWRTNPAVSLSDLNATVAIKAPINNPTFTGTVTLAADPALSLQAATKQYVDSVGNSVGFLVPAAGQVPKLQADNANTNGGFYRGTTTTPTGTMRLTYSGYFACTKIYNPVYADYAEYFPKADELEAGDVVSFDPETGKFKKSTVENDRLIAGVVSDNYAQCIGGSVDPEENERLFTPVGLCGRIDVKVIGDITYGNLLTSSSIPGVAKGIKAGDIYIPGTIIGKALESHTGNEVSKIKMLIFNA